MSISIRKKILLNLKEAFRSAAQESVPAVFTHVYEENLWCDSETLSGRGSTLAATTHLRQDLKKFLEAHNADTIADIGCGDFNWFRELGHPYSSYHGYDVVPKLIERNRKLYEDDRTHFYLSDSANTPIQRTDILLCRDVMIHLSYKDIYLLLREIEKSSTPEVLFSQYANCENNDKETNRKFRPIDYTFAPFYFPKPKTTVQEGMRTSFNPLSTLQKNLCHWSMKDILPSLYENPAYQSVISEENSQKPVLKL